MECAPVLTLAQALTAIPLSAPTIAAPTSLLAAERTVGLWGLFAQSFDLFTIVLLGGSFAAGPGPDGGWIVEAALPARAES